ncbi:MAG: hypothetical protein BGO31_02595 [Bacteroidetes bacterium 43-16]|nr:MAG: hypothetical protein BGO31_02595 [Bacteroidetes bacterium 43-16]
MYLNKISKGILFSGLLATLALTSCKKEDPQHNHDNEEYDKIKVHLIALDASGVQSLDTVSIEYNAHGEATPALSTIQADKSYRMLIQLYAHDELINNEIIADAAEHKFFFFSTPSSAVSNYVYNDDNIGLDGKITFAGLGDIKVQALLRHGLNKSHADAQAYNSANYQNAGGSNDINITLDLKAQ